MATDEYTKSLNINLAQFQLDAIDRHGDATALVDAKTGRSYTYPEVKDRIQRLAAGLRDLGLRQGDVLCMLTFNHIDYHIVWYATCMLGATFQTASPGYTDEDLMRRFTVCQTKFLVTSPDLARRISSMIHTVKLRSPSLSKPNIINTIIVLGEAPGCVSFDSLFTDQRVTKVTPVDPSRDVAIYLSSSGTTGLPKNVKLTHRNIASNLTMLREKYPLPEDTCMMSVLPMFHHYGVHSTLNFAIYSGFKTVVMETFNFDKMVHYIPAYKVSFLPIVPPIALRLVKYKNPEHLDFSTVTTIMSAAASMGFELEMNLRKRFNLKYVAQAYGLTETGFNTGCNALKYKPGSCGTTPSNLRVKIVDPESDRPLPANQTGEIRVAGPQITTGYLDNPKETAAAFDEEGFFRTGDLGYLDGEGFLFVVDRLKELIKYKGLQVAPAYLEDMLLKHPDVADVAVIGVPDEEAGELPKAFIVRQPGHAVTAGQIQKYVQDNAASHMRLRGGVEFMDVIPKSPSGKILRRMLRQHGVKAKL